jgi:hypothetical protein
MSEKYIVVSYDDLWEGNDNWDAFVEFQKKIPNFKATFFVNPGQCSEAFLRKIDQPWSELAYHCENHSGGFKNWTKEEAIQHLMKYHKNYNFVKGFKAPGWKITQNLIEACKELDFWVSSISTIPVDIEKKYYVYYKKGEGLLELKEYVQYYGHLQSHNFNENLKELEEYVLKNNNRFKFVSEVI